MTLFGTDGLRGKAGVFPLDSASVERLGREVGRRAGAAAAGKPTIVVGGDTRQSTPALVSALCRGIMESGCAPASAGIIPTPAVAELTVSLSAAAGLSVSASHNPWEDNGIKIFGPDGRKWADEEEASLERLLLDSREAAISPSPALPLPPSVDESLAETYVELLLSKIPGRLGGLHAIVDAGNGAAFRVGPEALRRAGARVTALNDRPDGRNINAGCGALHPEGMARVTRESGAAIGVAFDGDADRSIFSDETGRVLDGDDVLWIAASTWKREGTLPKGGVVGTVMSNWGLEAALKAADIPFARAAVGDRNVARLMEERGAGLGGETSGHILLPFSPAGDGILTTLLVAAITAGSGRKLSSLATLVKTPQQLRNVRVARRLPIEEVPAIGRAVARAESALALRGRVFLRYSGTEPLLRILVEGYDAEAVSAIADDLEAAVRAELA